MTNLDELHLALEHAAYGTLHALCLFTKPFEESAAYVILRQIAFALREIHQNQIVHSDIKESNILTCFSYENQFKRECATLPLAWKISDFGVSRDLSEITNIGS